MNKKIERLIDKCAYLTPLDGRVLVVSDKLRTYKEKQFKTYPKDPDIKEEDVDHETEMVMEEVMADVNYRYQTATVLQTPTDEIRFKVGDIIVYQIGALKEFDLVKGVSTLRKYEVEFIKLS